MVVVAADMAAFDDGIGNRRRAVVEVLIAGVRMGDAGAREIDGRRYRLKLDV